MKNSKRIFIISVLLIVLFIGGIASLATTGNKINNNSNNNTPEATTIPLPFTRHPHMPSDEELIEMKRTPEPTQLSESDKSGIVAKARYIVDDYISGVEDALMYQFDDTWDDRKLAAESRLIVLKALKNELEKGTHKVDKYVIVKLYDFQDRLFTGGITPDLQQKINSELKSGKDPLEVWDMCIDVFINEYKQDSRYFEYK